MEEKKVRTRKRQEGRGSTTPWLRAHILLTLKEEERGTPCSLICFRSLSREQNGGGDIENSRKKYNKAGETRIAGSE